MDVDKTHPEAGFVELEPLVIAGLDVVWVIVGLLAVLILFGFWLVLYVLNAMFGGISIFGFHPFTFALDLANAGMKKAVGLLDSKVAAFADFLYGIIATVWRFAYVAVDTVIVLWWRDIAHQQQSQAGIQNETNRATTAENNEVQNRQSQVGAVDSSLQSQIDAIDTNLANLGANLSGELLDLSHTESNDFTRLQNEINGLHVPDLTELQTQINQVRTDLTNEINHDVSTINATINRDVQDLTQQIGAGVSTAEQFALGAATGAEAGAVAQVLAQLQPQINAIKTETDECLDPLCDTVTPNAKQLGDLGKLLKDLEGLFAAGALMALLVAAVEDPKGTAKVVTDVMGWVAPLSVDLVNVVGEAAGVVL